MLNYIVTSHLIKFTSDRLEDFKQNLSRSIEKYFLLPHIIKSKIKHNKSNVYTEQKFGTSELVSADQNYQ